MGEKPGRKIKAATIKTNVNKTKKNWKKKDF